jgi:hypothetical protein
MQRDYSTRRYTSVAIILHWVMALGDRHARRNGVLR